MNEIYMKNYAKQLCMNEIYMKNYAKQLYIEQCIYEELCKTIIYRTVYAKQCMNEIYKKQVCEALSQIAIVTGTIDTALLALPTRQCHPCMRLPMV